MTWQYSDEYYKNYTRDTWNESAPMYDPVLRNLDLFNPDLLRHAKPAQGERVLDIGTGPGQPALSMAPDLLPGGSVLGIDLSEKMIEIARERAKAATAENATFEVMDAEDLKLEDDAFDLVVSRFGLQIVTDPERTISEAYRVLKPGGRFVATVWGLGENCPAIHVVIAPMLEHAEPDETGYLPTPYEMGGPGELTEILQAHGFRNTREERLTRDWTFTDEAEYMSAFLKGTPVGHSLEEEDEDVQREVLQKTRENLKRYTTSDGISLPGECVVVSGVK